MCMEFKKKNPCIDSIDSLQIIPRNGEDKFPNDFLKLSYDLLHPQQLYIYICIYSIQYIYIYIFPDSGSHVFCWICFWIP